MTFDGFISYSHAADGRLAPAVQRGLHRLAKPWHRRRALWIFRDQTGLAVTPGLWSSIQTALDGSEYFVLLASPEAARSQWVNREIEHWIATKAADRILPVVTDGEWAWDADRGDFAEGSTAVPPALRGVFKEEPFFLDLRWARGSEHLSLHHSRFRDAIAQLAAPMHGVSKDELEGEDVRQHRRAKRLRSGAVVTLVVLALVASVTGMSAVRNAERAKAAAAEALRQQEVADTQRDSAQRSAEEARRQQELALQQQDLAQKQRTRAAQAAAAADESERQAQEQQRLADQAAAEARRQRRLADEAGKLADEAATRTKEQQALAKKQEQLAKEASERAQRLQKEAQQQARIAAEQRRLAGQAAAEAAKQQAKADQQQRIAVSRRLMNQSVASIVDDPRTALMLGVAAQEINPDAATGSRLTGVVTATNYAGEVGDVTRAAYGPDGVLVALGSDGRVSLWNVAQPRDPVRLATLPDAVAYTVELTRDGRTLAVVNGREVALWDVADRSRPARLGTIPSAHNVSAIAFGGADGGTVVVGDEVGAATLWDTGDRLHPTQLATLSDADTRFVTRVAMSPDGNLVVLDKGRFVPVFDLSIPEFPVRAHLIVPFGETPMTFSPDGKTLVAGNPDGTIDLYDSTGESPFRIAQNEAAPTVTSSEVTPPDMTPPGMTPPGMTPPDENSPGMTPPEETIEPPPPLPSDEPDTGPFARLTGLTGSVTALAFSADGGMLAAGDQYGTTTVWNRTSHISSGIITSVQAHGPVATLSFDPKGGTLVTTDGSATATLWTVPAPGTPTALAMIDIPATPRTTVFGPDGRSLIAAGGDGVARSWNIADPTRPVPGADVVLRGERVGAVAYSPDGRTVAYDAETLTLADATQPNRATKLGVTGLNGLAFSPDGRTLAAVVGHATLMLWDVADRARPTLLAGVGGLSFGAEIAFSPDGRALAVSSDQDPSITLWNVANRSAPTRLATLLGHSGAVYALAFSPDGHTLASGGFDRTTVLWDLTDRTRPYRLATLSGHAGSVFALAFSPDGHTLATGGGDYAVMLWDTTTAAVPIQLARMRTASISQAVGLVFHRDGRTLAVTGQPDIYVSNVTLWNYGKLNGLRADPAKYACAVTGRGLTADEWARFIPELKYRRTC